MGMGFAPTWLRQVSPLLHKTTLTTDNGSLEPGRPSRARSANTRHPAGRPHTPLADRMYATDRQTDVRHRRLMPPGRGHNNLLILNQKPMVMKLTKCTIIAHCAALGS